MTEAKYEKANKFIVNALARCPDKYGIDQNSVPCLERINKKMKGNHTFETSWTNKKGAINKGRRFPKTSLAGLARPIRNALAQQYYWDCDMKNAAFTTIANIITVNDWDDDFPEIMNYHANRERLLEHVILVVSVLRKHLSPLSLAVMLANIACLISQRLARRAKTSTYALSH